MTRVTPAFVEVIPEILEQGVLYISMAHATVLHLCCCGCGQEVVTPLSPIDWELHYDGRAVSLDPSIGSWSLPCQSHYWITKNSVRWARRFTLEEVKTLRSKERRRRAAHFGEGPALPD